MMTACAYATAHSSKEKLDHHKEIQLSQNIITGTVITHKTNRNYSMTNEHVIQTQDNPIHFCT